MSFENAMVTVHGLMGTGVAVDSGVGCEDPTDGSRGPVVHVWQKAGPEEPPIAVMLRHDEALAVAYGIIGAVLRNNTLIAQLTEEADG